MLGQPGYTFVGRKQEMAVLERALKNAVSGQVRLVMLAGEPGIGKTRLSQELAAHAEDLGVQVHWGRCYEGEGAPSYWPWVQPLRACLREKSSREIVDLMGLGAADISEICPEVRSKLPNLEPSPSMDPEHARFRLFESITGFWTRVSLQTPTMIVLEDLHDADRSSLLLLEFLARQIGESRLLLVGTYRDVEVSRRHPLYQTLGNLIREQLFLRVDLRGFTKTDVGQFVQSHTGVTLADDVLEIVHGRTHGNPLFLGELAKLLDHDDPASSELWTQALPEGVREVISRRLDRLSDTCNQALTTASVIGREFDFQLLSSLSNDLDEERLLETLEEALAARVIEELSQSVGHYQFTHALIQETLREDVSLTRRVRMHFRIGESLEYLYSDDIQAHASELAYHFGQAKSLTPPGKLAHYSLLAGERALAAYAYEDALEHFQRALAAKAVSDKGKAEDGEEASIRFGLGRAQLVVLDFIALDEAVGNFRMAFDYFVQLNDLERAVAVAEHNTRPLMPGGRSGMGEIISKALGLVAPESRQAGLLLARYSEIMVAEGDELASRDASTRAIEIARQCNDSTLELQAITQAARNDMSFLHFRETLAKCETAFELAVGANDPLPQAYLSFFSTVAYYCSGDLKGARVQAARTQAFEAKVPVERRRRWFPMSENLSAHISQLEGDWGGARNAIERSGAEIEWHSFATGALALVALQVGDFEEGHSRLSELQDIAPMPGLPLISTPQWQCTF